MSKQITVERALEIALAVVDSELEMPGPLPPALLNKMKALGWADSTRLTVRITKDLIHKRLEDTFAVWNAE